MRRVLFAETAVFLCLHTIRMGLLILRRIVVSLLAFCAGKCNTCTQVFHLTLNYVLTDSAGSSEILFCAESQTADDFWAYYARFHTPDKYITVRPP